LWNDGVIGFDETEKGIIVLRLMQLLEIFLYRIAHVTFHSLLITIPHAAYFAFIVTPVLADFDP
jgi:hypothetical protein